MNAIARLAFGHDDRSSRAGLWRRHHDRWVLGGGDRFLQSGTISFGPTDRTMNEMIKPGVHDFYTPINQSVKNPKSWEKTYSWNVISAKGFQD